MTVWETAQRHERVFWERKLRDGGLARLLRVLDYDHQRGYLDFAADTIGLNRPSALVLDLGCGPCGFAPWIRARSRYGIEPLAGWFAAEYGLQYDTLGYAIVLEGTIEEAAEILPWAVRNADIVLCINVLDHAADALAAATAISQLGHVGTELLLVYDLRLVATALHPAITPKSEIDNSLNAAWTLLRESQSTNIEPPNESPYRLFQHWNRIR